eukprot:gene4648-6532_t
MSLLYPSLLKYLVDDSIPDEHDDKDGESDELSCCLNTCNKRRMLYGKVVCGTFKTYEQANVCGLFSLMISALIAAIILPLVIYAYVDSAIYSEVVIDSPNAAEYSAWQSNVGSEDMHVTYDLYMFDVQNPNEILQGAKPVVVEKGPYAFDEYFNKFDIVWTDDGDTVTYNTQKYYLFNKERSAPGLSLSDSVTVPYATVIGFQYLLGAIPQYYSDLLNTKVTDKISNTMKTIEGALYTLYDQIDKMKHLPDDKKKDIENKITTLEVSVNTFFQGLYDFVDESAPVDLIMKTLLCNVKSGISPFWKTNPFDAWFGWLNDPVMLEVLSIIDIIEASNPNISIPWSAAIPGSAVNWTTIEDTRRRRAPDTFKTGKKNMKQVSQYVRYSNMSSLWTCIAPMNSQNESEYVEGKQFPACAKFQYDWTDEEAISAGYVQPYGTEVANRIKGTDAQMFGRPIQTDKLQVYISDIYRSCYIEQYATADWGGVPVRRYTIQTRDMSNASTYPPNADYYYFGPSGMANLTKAVNVPVFLSFPHFLNGDPRLVEAVTGMHPDPEKHSSYLDMEPQTGLLARAQKSLQVVYHMTPLTLPTLSPDALPTAQELCYNLTSLFNLTSHLPNYKEEVDLPLPSSINCELPTLTPLFNCLSLPSTWSFQNGDDGIFFPYGWVTEGVVLPDSDAEELSNSLFMADNLADAIRKYSLIAAGGFCFLLLLQLYYINNNNYKNMMNQKTSFTIQTSLKKSLSFGSVKSNPNDANNNNNASVTEPLLGATTSNETANNNNNNNNSNNNNNNNNNSNNNGILFI